jgi:hypothetical protein
MMLVVAPYIVNVIHRLDPLSVLVVVGQVQLIRYTGRNGSFLEFDKFEGWRDVLTSGTTHGRLKNVLGIRGVAVSRPPELDTTEPKNLMSSPTFKVRTVTEPSSVSMW